MQSIEKKIKFQMWKKPINNNKKIFFFAPHSFPPFFWIPQTLTARPFWFFFPNIWWPTHLRVSAPCPNLLSISCKAGWTLSSNVSFELRPARSRNQEGNSLQDGKSSGLWLPTPLKILTLFVYKSENFLPVSLPSVKRGSKNQSS